MVSTGATANVSISVPAALTALRSYAVPDQLFTGVIVIATGSATAPAENVTVAWPSALVTEPPADVITFGPVSGGGVVVVVLDGGATPLAVPVCGFGGVVP